MAKVHRTPGIYINEENSPFNPGISVVTDVPAFIGYTEKAEREGASLLLRPTRISSYLEYVDYFGGEPTTKFKLVSHPEPQVPYQLQLLEGNFCLHRHLKMFFANGGRACYIVSVGNYRTEAGNANTIELSVLESGLAPLIKEAEPSLLVIPEAVHVSLDPDHRKERLTAITSLQAAMLRHCGREMKNRFAILDVPMNLTQLAEDNYDMDADVSSFRNGIGSENLGWGAAYYPWMRTTALQITDIGLANIENLGVATDRKTFAEGTFNEAGEIIDRAGFQSSYVDGEITSLLSFLDKSLNEEVLNGVTKADFATKVKQEVLPRLVGLDLADTETLTEINNVLLAVSPAYKKLLHELLEQLNLLPPSAAMAGVYAEMDNQQGVFHAPANAGIISVVKPALDIQSAQQEDLNVPLDGKAVNAIRFFLGRGVLIWGARTLDGNSQDWRYINVRRLMIYLEQSIKQIMEVYVSEPNTAATWNIVKVKIENFLADSWKEGALMGATPKEAFSVEVGLGSTMTSMDISEDWMRVAVVVAVVRPAEFIVIDLSQRMIRG